MKPRLIVPLFIAAMLLAFGTIAAACGGDGEGLTLEEYFQRVDALDEDFDARIDAVEDEFPAAFEDPAATSDFFDAALRIFTDFVDALDDIDPPAAVEDDHNEAVDAGGEFGERLQDLTDRLADVESTSELEALLEEDDPELEAASDRFEQACLALQDIADDNGIVVDLECEDEE